MCVCMRVCECACKRKAPEDGSNVGLKVELEVSACAFRTNLIYIFY